MPPLPAIQNIETEKSKFKNITHELNNYNEIFNLNTYMLTTGNKDRTRLEKTNEIMKGKIMKYKQEFIVKKIQTSGINSITVYNSGKDYCSTRFLRISA